MKAALFLAFILLQAAPAVAESPNQAALREARAFFIPCAKLPKDEQPKCKENQADFVDGYLHAKAGRDDYMSQITTFFGTHPPGPTDPPYWGIKHDKRQACAWMIVRHESVADPGLRHSIEFYFRAECGDASPNELQAITERADQLLYELRTAPTVALQPRASTIGPKCMYHTATSLFANPDEPSEPLPPDCPNAPKSPSKNR
jgi:hypothetical protein